jgi:outer membrane protein TolC
LPIDEAVHIAVERDPVAARFDALADGLQAESTARGQLPDPRVRFGFLNLPTDTFKLDQEPMTQVLLGVQQMFPRGDLLDNRSRQDQALASAERGNAADQRLKTAVAVRKNWLELYYWQRAIAVVGESEDLFAQLVDITRALYSAGRQNQHDVVRAQLELSRLADRQTQYRSQADVMRAELAKWIGAEHAARPLADDFPELAAVPGKAQLSAHLAQHPQLLSSEAQIHAMDAKVSQARDLYSPEWGLDVSYGWRDGTNVDGSDRADFASVMLLMDMPLFTGQRQDQELAARQRQAGAARLARDDRQRQLQGTLDADYATWERLGERLALYENAVLPQSQQYALATQQAYQNDRADFPTLVRARIDELDTRLQTLRLRVERAKAQAQLIYLAGEQP